MTLDDAKSAVANGSPVGAVYPLLGGADGDELRRWFVYELKRGIDHPHTPAVKPKRSAAAISADHARAAGYAVGESCSVCQGMRMTRNGACLKCEDCGSTTGCS